MASPLTIASKSPASISTSGPSTPPRSPLSTTSSLAGLAGTPRPPPPVEIPRLHQAAQVNDLAFLDQVSSTSQTPDLDVNLRDAQGITALHWASINGHVLFVKGLLARGADVDPRGGDLSGTPLMWACRNGHVAVAHLLVLHSADPTLTDSQSFNALHLAVHSSSAYLLAYLLFTLQPVAVDSTDHDGHSSLAWACYQGDAISVELLLKAGASPSRPDHQGLTPLHWAVTKGNAACIKRIVEAGADLDAKDERGKTARDMAVELKSLPSYVKALSECARDESGRVEDVPLSPRNTRLAIFVVPTVALGVMAKTFEHTPSVWIGLVIVAFEAFALHYTVTKVLLGIRRPNQSDRITKSPYLCSIIVASLVWVGWVWITRYLHTPDRGTANLVFAILFTLCCAGFYKAITLDPGKVPYSKNDIELKE
ncbi:hypothetical protein JCM10212_002415, partial [Sporobolomyces blumeae]